MQNHRNAMWARRHERKGWVTAAIAAAPAVVSTVGQLTGGGTVSARDQERFGKAQEWYRLAKAGDKDAECALKHMTGRYGCANCGRFGQACGFPDPANKYTGQLYDQFVQQKSGIMSPNAPIPAPPGGGTSASPPGAATISVQTQTGPQGSGISIQAGSNPPQTPQEQKSKMLTFLLFGVAIAGGLTLWLMRRR